MSLATATTLKLDPTLPPKSWETRGGGRKPKRSRREIDAERFVAALEDPKVEEFVVGESAHQDLVRVMAQPGVKTDAQQRLEDEANLSRTRPEPRIIESPRCGQGFALPWDSGPEPRGTPGPGGAAS